MSSIRVSDKHGVNPSIECCLFCKKETGIVLFGKLTASEAKAMFGAEHVRESDQNDVKAPRAIFGLTPCEGCEVFEKHSKDGVFLVECIGDVPTGSFVAITDASVRRICNDEALIERIIETRILLVDQSAWRALGLSEVRRFLEKP